ncbi:hypothetical protein E0928_22315, partial [Salmonella enterica subsp. enterica serovar Virchow]|nr:hypothetical protein [Salmonella enterica subsp. enterica serovar Virchow]
MMNMGFDGGVTPAYVPGYDTPWGTPTPASLSRISPDYFAPGSHSFQDYLAPTPSPMPQAARFAVPALPRLHRCPFTGCAYSTPLTGNLNLHELTCPHRPADMPAPERHRCPFTGCAYSTPLTGNLNRHER